MTTFIEGRSRYDDKADFIVEVYPMQGQRAATEPVLSIKGGYIERRENSFVIAARHQSAVDCDHSGVYVAMLDGIGTLTFNDMYMSDITFTGVIMSAQFYTEAPEPEDVGECDRGRCAQEPHGFLDFVPPTQKWNPGMYQIKVKVA